MVGQVRRAVGERTARMPKGCVSEVGIGCFRDEGQEGEGGEGGEGGEEPEACRPEDPKTGSAGFRRQAARGRHGRR